MDFFIQFLNEMANNLEMFALCKDFNKLTLEDDTGSSSSSSTSLVQPSSSSTSQVQPSSYGYRDAIHRFLNSRTFSSLWSQSISDKLRAPFIELPRNWMESSLQSYNIRMGLGFRFLPGQSQFLIQELRLPESFDRLYFISNNLGLSYNSRPLSNQLLFSSSNIGSGLRGLVNERITKILVEVITHYDGMYGRFLVLVCLGIGSTVWYAFTPGSADHAPDSSLFAPLASYEPFLNVYSNTPDFSRVGFVERNDVSVSASVVSAMENEHPFADITIPASGNVLKAVGLGVMVAFFLAVGIVPNYSGGINVQL